MPGPPTSPAWTISSELRSAESACGRSNPSVSEITPMLRIADPKDAAPQHARGGACTATGRAIHVRYPHMSWSTHGPPPGRRGYHHGNLREALIRATLDLIAERGLSGFTFAEAARAAGVSSAAPYRHYRDRQDLVADVAREGFERFGAELARAWSDGRRAPRAPAVRAAPARLPPSRTSAVPISPSRATSPHSSRPCSRAALRRIPTPSSPRPPTGRLRSCAPRSRRCARPCRSRAVRRC